jgi:hypothetical protein
VLLLVALLLSVVCEKTSPSPYYFPPFGEKAFHKPHKTAGGFTAKIGSQRFSSGFVKTNFTYKTEKFFGVTQAPKFRKIYHK